MSADPCRVQPRLRIERPIFQAARELIRQTETLIEGVLDQPIRLIMTGGAAMALYSPTRSSADVDAIFSHPIILPEVLVSYRDEYGKLCKLTWDRNYSPSIGLMHPEAEQDAVFVAPSSDGRFDILVLTPLDLSTSKIGRYADNDQRDIQELFEDGLIAPEDLERRVAESLGYYVGNVRQVHHNMVLALENMGYRSVIPPPAQYKPMEPTRLKYNDARRLADNSGSEMPVHCLSDIPVRGVVLSLSDDRSVAFLLRGQNLTAIYRADCAAMPELSALKGKMITIREKDARLVIEQQVISSPALEHAFHNGLISPPPSGCNITGTVRALVKDANANTFALVDTGDGKAFAVPVSDTDRDRLVIGETATFEAVRESAIGTSVAPSRGAADRARHYELVSRPNVATTQDSGPVPGEKTDAEPSWHSPMSS